jgi:orotate phosphoribosyltransferase
METHQGEKVLLVDDILRTGNKLRQLKALAEEAGAEVVGLAVMIYQPNPKTPSFRSAALVLPGAIGWTLLHWRRVL